MEKKPPEFYKKLYHDKRQRAHAKKSRCAADIAALERECADLIPPRSSRK